MLFFTRFSLHIFVSNKNNGFALYCRVIEGRDYSKRQKTTPKASAVIFPSAEEEFVYLVPCLLHP